MKLKILGSGTIKPMNPVRNCSGYLINDCLLLDCGPGIWRAFMEAGISLSQVHHICLSHFHPDHVADLPAILMSRYLMRDEVKQTLYLGGSEALPDWFEKVKAVCGSWIQKMAIEIVTFNNLPVNFAGFTIQTARTGHTNESICYRLQDRENKILFYSGDSGYNENLISLANEANVVLLEASMTENTRVEGHLTPGLAAKIAFLARAECLILTHLYPHTHKINVREEVQMVYSGKFILALDGMELRF